MLNTGNTVIVRGADEFMAMMRGIPSAVDGALAKAGARIRMLVISRARLYCPISPTKAQYEATLKGRKKVHHFGEKSGVPIFFDPKTGRVRLGAQGRAGIKSTRHDFNPGGLMLSITGESGSWGASIFVPLNSAGGVYANYIHNMKNKEGGWRKRGIGTIMKGPQADERFIERAVSDTQEAQRVILLDEGRSALMTRGFSVK